MTRVLDLRGCCVTCGEPDECKPWCEDIAQQLEVMNLLHLGPQFCRVTGCNSIVDGDAVCERPHGEPRWAPRDLTRGAA